MYTMSSGHACCCTLGCSNFVVDLFSDCIGFPCPYTLSRCTLNCNSSIYKLQKHAISTTACLQYTWHNACNRISPFRPCPFAAVVYTYEHEYHCTWSSNAVGAILRAISTAQNRSGGDRFLGGGVNIVTRMHHCVTCFLCCSATIPKNALPWNSCVGPVQQRNSFTSFRKGS